MRDNYYTHFMQITWLKHLESVKDLQSWYQSLITEKV